MADAEGIEALPGTVALLAGLPAERWAVVTSATRRLARARLSGLGLHPRRLVAADDITRGKPDPEPYLLGAAKLGFAPGDCVVFEDSAAGVTAARAAGMRVVGVGARAAALAPTAHAPTLEQVRVEPAGADGTVRLTVTD